MTALLTIVLFGCLAAVHCTHVIGRFGKQVYNADIEFDADHDMIVQIHSPHDVYPTFRDTENLHIFPTHHVAVKNLKDKQCYVRQFVETIDRIIGRMENAVYNNGEMNRFMIHRLNLDGLNRLDDKTVENVLGTKIANFCKGLEVYFLGPNELTILNAQEAYYGAHSSRDILSNLEVGGFCGGFSTHLQNLKYPNGTLMFPNAVLG